MEASPPSDSTFDSAVGELFMLAMVALLVVMADTEMKRPAPPPPPKRRIWSSLFG